MPEQAKTPKVLLVLGHGKTESLCHHLLRVAQAFLEERGAACRVHDLLADGFDPVLRLEPGQDHTTRCPEGDESLLARYQNDVRWADAYVVVHPVWWFAPPANLKGWVDRVFVDQVAIRQPPSGAPEPLLEGRRAVVVQTFNVTPAIDKVIFANVTRLFWKRAVFLPVGIKDVRRLALYTVGDMSEATLERHLKRLRQALTALTR